METKKIHYILIVIATILMFSCTEKSVQNLSKITPEQLPVVVDGFNFPEDSLKILKWINDSQFAPNNYDSISVYKHAWGIWAGLTTETNQELDGNKLLVYETWLGLNEVRNAVEQNKTNCDGIVKKDRTPLTFPKQFEHSQNFANVNASKRKSSKKLKAAEPNFSLWVSVSYSPDAACFATENKIFKQSVINSYYKKENIGKIKDFPQKSVTIKPTYLVFHDNSKLKKLPVWLNTPNPPDSLDIQDFPYCVYIDTENKQPAHKKAIPILQNNTNPDAIKKATVNLDEFINLKINKNMANYMNQQDSIQGINAKDGDLAILVAMHVSTKEIDNWTWQSFYWTPDRDNPGAPSSKLAASVRPKMKNKAANNYAANAAYVMTTPNNSPDGSPMFGYNPYLEGGFGPSTFPYPNKRNPNYKFGMQTNCMNCHGLAVASPQGLYSTAQYINMKDLKYFGNQVQLDFAWSIQTAIINDTIPYWKFK